MKTHVEYDDFGEYVEILDEENDNDLYPLCDLGEIPVLFTA